MNENLSDKIIGRIDNEQISPLPRWRFILWRGLFWLFAILSVIIGGIAVGTMLFLFNGLYISGFLAIPHDIIELLLLVPYLWLIVFVLFILIARISIKHTKGGYKYGLGFIILTSVFLSVILGSVFYITGIGKMTHEYLNEFPVYNYAVHDEKEAWEMHTTRLPHNQ
jgi:hypothetical protein